MKFFPNYPTNNNKGQRQIWNALKNMFSSDEGVVYYGYPIFQTQWRGRKEPDFLMIHRKYGIWVFESKGCAIENIDTIEGHEWAMREWYSETMSPVSQAEAQFYEVKNLVERNAEIKKLRLPFEYRVLLPFITQQEWQQQGFSKHPSTNGVVWLDEDLEPARFRRHLQEATAKYMPQLNDEQWEQLLCVFRGTASDKTPRQPILNSPPNNHSRTIHAVENRLRLLDDKQSRISQEVPEGRSDCVGLQAVEKLFCWLNAWHRCTRLTLIGKLLLYITVGLLINKLRHWSSAITSD